jgi:hypothetical protein
MTGSECPGHAAPLQPGEWAEVRNHFNGEWSPGFVVESTRESGYMLRRMRDDALLPRVLAFGDVRRMSVFGRRSLDGEGTFRFWR